MRSGAAATGAPPGDGLSHLDRRRRAGQAPGQTLRLESLAPLEARAIHTVRTARNHLLALAATQGIRDRRVDEVIDLVGLADVASKRVGGFSLGMGQRLGIAVALLADPATVVLDEPVNGLDPEGIMWIRNLLRRWPPRVTPCFCPAI